jgi:hypothetical protein
MSEMLTLSRGFDNNFTLINLQRHMKKRGKVLRDATAGSGLLMVDGQQYPFSIAELWRSEVAPKSGMVVEVEFEQYGKIRAIYAVADPQLGGGSREATRRTNLGGLEIPSFAAAGVLILAWYFLSSISIQTPLGRLDFTFWQILGYLNSGKSLETFMQPSGNAPGAGVYGFLALVAIAGSFLRQLWKDKHAALGGFLPLLFMAVVGVMVWSNVKSSLGGAATGALGAATKQMRDEAMAAASLGPGAYLSALVSAYCAAIARKQFLRANTGKPEPKSARRAAA